MAMKDPLLCGSLLFQFFNGSANIAAIRDPARPVTIGQEESNGTEAVQTVSFYESNAFGNVVASIGKTTGLVYRIEYDSDPAIQSFSKQSGTSHHMTTVETFSNIRTDFHPSATDFDATLPKGFVAIAAKTDEGNRPPVPFGKPAPEFAVRGLDGKAVRLSGLRGHVVLLDFWATWCPPCRKGLPETAGLAKRGAAHGLQVLAISGEEAAPVSAFLKQQTYRLPAYLDASNATGSKYNADAIPTTVIIDARGNLAAYFVGLHESTEIEAALVKAGAILSPP